MTFDRASLSVREAAALAAAHAHPVPATAVLALKRLRFVRVLMRTGRIGDWPAIDAQTRRRSALSRSTPH